MKIDKFYSNFKAQIAYFVICTMLLFGSSTENVYAAYSCSPTASNTITPTCTAQTTPGFTGIRALNMTLTAGVSYNFQTCGLSSADTYLRLYSGLGTTLVTSSDDACGLQSNITYTAPSTGTYSLLVAAYSCGSLGSTTQVLYQQVSGCGPSSCTNTSSYGSATINTSGTLVTISTCSYAGEYSTISGAVAGQTLQFTMSNLAGTWITIHSGSYNGPVLAQGTSPLSFANTYTGTIYAHWNTNSSCGTYTACHTTTVQCTSCSAPSGCTNSSSYGSATLPGNNNLVTISTCSYAGEYSTISGATAGQTLQFTMSNLAGTWITVHSGSYNGPVLAQGSSPLTFVNTYTGTLYAHWNTNSSCGTYTACHTTTVQCTSCPSAGPANDACAGAITIACGATISSTTVGANTDATTCSSYSSPGVWYKVTPTQTSTITASLCGSSYDTYISIYNGSCGGACVTSNDDFCGLQSQVTFSATAGVTYYILVNGFSTSSGSFTLSVNCAVALPPPSNDDCSGVPITPITIGTPYTFSGNSQGATATSDGAFSSYPTVWHAFSLTSCADVTLSYCANSPVMGNVWLDLATSCPANTFITDNSYEAVSCGNGNYTVTFNNVQAGTYWIPIIAESTTPGFIVTPGPYSLTVNTVACPPPPCTTAIPVTCGSSTTGSTIGAPSVGTPGSCFVTPTGAGRYYQVTPTAGGAMTVSLCGSGYDTYLTIWTGCPTLNCVAGNDDFCGLQSEVSFTATANATYYILVSGFAGSTGSYTLTVTCPCTNPAVGGTISYGGPTTSCVNVALPAISESGGNGSFQWQSSTDNGVTFNDISGATSSTLNYTPTSEGSYLFRNRRTTCTESYSVNPLGITITGAPTASASVSPTAVCPGDEVVLTGSGSIPSAGTYCSTTSTFGCSGYGDEITNLTFANISRTSGCDLYVYTTSPVAPISAGVGIPISISTGVGNLTNEGVAVWIDLNQDGTFSSGELLYSSYSGADPAVYNGTIIVPTSAYNGTTRMRVECKYAQIPTDPCDNTGYGEFEDYNVTISGATPNPSSNVTYSWTSSPAGFTASTANVTANPTVATAYTLSVSAGGCTTTATTTQVTMNSAPVTIAASSSTVCNNGSPIALSSNFDGPYAVYSGPGVSGSTFDPSLVSPGNSTVTVTYTPPTGCSGNASMNITVLPLPDPNATNTTLAAPKCEGITVALTASPSGSLSPYSISWSGLGFGYLSSQSITPPSNIGSPVVFSGASGQSLPGISGPYIATVTDARGCTNTETTILIVHANPTVQAVVISPVCAGTSITFNSNVDWHGENPSSYAWFNPLGDNIGSGSTYTIPNVTVDDAADLIDIYGYEGYAFTATNAAGCSNNDGFSLHVISAPVFDANPGNQSANNDLNNCSAVVNYGPVTASSGEYWYTSNGYGFGVEYFQPVATTLSYQLSSGPSGSGDGSGSIFNVGTTQVDITASNSCSNLDNTLTFYVNVNDNEIPVITAAGDNTPLQCNPSLASIDAALGTASATDNCGVGAPSYTDSPVNADGCDRCQTRTWNVTDVHNNAAVAVSRTVCWIEDHSTPEIIVQSTIADAGCNPSAGDVDFYLGTAVIAVNQVLPSYCNHNSLEVSDGPVTNVGCNYQQTRYWVATNSCSGNTSTASHTVNWVVDTQAPQIVSIPSNVTVSCVAEVPDANDGAVTATDNCSDDYTLSVTHDADVITPGSCVNRYSISRTYHVTDHCGNTSSQTQTITVNDQTSPVIAGCPSNIILSACTPAVATWTDPNASDNCMSGATVSQTGGPASGYNPPANGVATTITYTATDACGNSSNCSFTVTRRAALTLNAGLDEQTYFGYSADQALTHTVTGVSGGHLPYNYSWTMQHLTTAALVPQTPGGLMCNQVTSSGDEQFIVGGSGTICNGYTSCTGTTPYINSVVPECHGLNATSVTVQLLDTARITCIITDADGCQAQSSFIVFAEDARCFAGNSSVQKVTICHRSGNNTCSSICVDESAVAAHLAHGDALGQCPRSGCPTSGKLFGDDSDIDAASYLTAYPNPFNEKTTIAFSVPKDGRAVIRIYDAVGKEIGVLFDGMAKSGEMYKVDFDGSKYAEGMYFYSITSDEMNQTNRMNLIK
jgi:hypothetical protein